MNNKTGMDGKTISAIVVGASIGIISFLVTHFTIRRERNRLQREISVLQRDLTEIKTELKLIKAQQKESSDKTDDDCEKRGRRRRRVRREINGYDSETTMYTAHDSDDEFFDLSSDEDGLVPHSQEEDTTQTFFNEIDDMMTRQINPLEILLSRAEEMNSNPNYLWRLAKAYKLEHDSHDEDKEKQLQSIEIGINHARRAVDLDPVNGDAHKWLAILLGLRTDFLATKEKLQNGMVFYKHLNLALEFKPSDHSLHYLLARFKFAIASLSWFERSAAKMIGELPDVSMDDVIRDAGRCEALSPQPMAENRLLLAKAYLAQNDSETGVKWLKQTKEVSPVDGAVYKEVVQLLIKYK